MHQNINDILLSRFQPNDSDKLLHYLQGLSADTKKRFGPHPFDRQSILDFYKHPQQTTGYIAWDNKAAEIIAYAIIRAGYLEHDLPRLRSYGTTISHETDCTFAPSVSDSWQGKGIGNKLFRFILADLQDMNIKRIILWGGVQADNDRAVHYYTKLGFVTLGTFDYNGPNYDMMLEISY